MAVSHVVRGYGPLDLFLAKRRYRVAKRQIKLAKKDGRILDIGSGLEGLFLIDIDFSDKYGLDRDIEVGVKDRMKEQGITLISSDIEREEKLPFEDDFFDVVSMLAVFEHIEPRHLVRVHREIHRVLNSGGMYFMTTPAVWTGPLLRLLAKLHLISDVPIREHKGSYSHARISSVLQEACFEKDKLRFGYFELFMNTWATATK